MIQNFRNRATEDLFHGVQSKAARRACPQQLWVIVHRKLDQLNQADRLDDLRAPPANRLERLKGDRAGQYSIRVNQQYRVCFRWHAAGPTDVEVVDYHG